MKKTFVLGLSFILLSLHVSAKPSDKYQELGTSDGVTFSYKWQAEKKSKKDSPLNLMIKIKNENEYKVAVNFTVDYYYKTQIKASSEEQSFCVKSKKVLLGRIKKLGFDRASLTNDQLLSDYFIIELANIRVTQSADCKQKK